MLVIVIEHKIKAMVAKTLFCGYRVRVVFTSSLSDQLLEFTRNHEGTVALSKHVKRNRKLMAVHNFYSLSTITINIFGQIEYDVKRVNDCLQLQYYS